MSTILPVMRWLPVGVVERLHLHEQLLHGHTEVAAADGRALSIAGEPIADSRSSATLRARRTHRHPVEGPRRRRNAITPLREPPSASNSSMKPMAPPSLRASARNALKYDRTLR